jgi:hypothetical protein
LRRAVDCRYLEYLYRVCQSDQSAPTRINYDLPLDSVPVPVGIICCWWHGLVVPIMFSPGLKHRRSGLLI